MAAGPPEGPLLPRMGEIDAHRDLVLPRRRLRLSASARPAERVARGAASDRAPRLAPGQERGPGRGVCGGFSVGPGAGARAGSRRLARGLGGPRSNSRGRGRRASRRDRRAGSLRVRHRRPRRRPGAGSGIRRDAPRQAHLVPRRAAAPGGREVAPEAASERSARLRQPGRLRLRGVALPPGRGGHRIRASRAQRAALSGRVVGGADAAGPGRADRRRARYGSPAALDQGIGARRA